MSDTYSVFGAIGEEWNRQGGSQGRLGNPLSNEIPFLDDIGRVQNFEGGTIFWNPQWGINTFFRDPTTSINLDELTGYWTADDGGIYFFKYVHYVLCWVGMSGDRGLSFTNVFRGAVFNNIRVSGDWMDVPRGNVLRGGSLAFDITLNTDLRTPGIQLRVTKATGGFGARVLNKLASSVNVSSYINSSDTSWLFEKVRRNDGGSMEDHLKLCRDQVVLYAEVLDAPHVNYPVDPNNFSSVSYENFICAPWWPRGVAGWGGDDPPDGDLDFKVQIIERPNDNFWIGGGWSNDINPMDIKNKLEDGNYIIGVETVMYGRAAECGDNDHYDSPPLLRGWQEKRVNSVRINGRSINGQLAVFPSEDPYQRGVFEIAGFHLHPRTNVSEGTKLRITGPMILDGHGFFDRFHEDDPDVHNVEIHPVYAIDVIQSTFQTNLTGVWSDLNDGTYYIREYNGHVWWFGLDRDPGPAISSMFSGYLNRDNGVLEGELVLIPHGFLSDLQDDSIDFTLEGNNILSSNARPWRLKKLYDVLPPESTFGGRGGHE